MLDGTRSTDADGKIVSYVWTQVLGPKVILEQIDRARSIFTSPRSIGQETTLIFKLTVTDDQGTSNSDLVNIKILKLNKDESSHSAEGDTRQSENTTSNNN